MSDKIYISELSNLMREWDWDKNTKLGLLPDELSLGSSKKVWWKCKKGHEWQTVINHRTKRNHGCPYCSGRFAIAGETDLATLNPKLVLEWHPTKNGDLKPNQVTVRSGKKVWWLCAKGHEWQATPHDRDTDNTKCPFCSARQQTSFPEQAIYFYIKKLFPDAVNRYKDIFSNSMELDIYIPSLLIGVEYDGLNWHRTETEHNREIKKYEICKNHGITLIRIKENNKNTWTDVADKIIYIEKRRNFAKLNKLINTLFEYILNIRDGIDNPLVSSQNLIVDVENDQVEIHTYLTDIENSLEALRPDLVEE